MNKIRANSYEAQLTPDELRDLHALLSKPGTSLAQAQQTAPPWRSGPLAGTKPGLTTLCKISSRLRAENRLLDMEATDKLLRAIMQKLQSNPKCTTELIDQLATIIGQDCLTSFVHQGSPRDRIDQFKLLLKRQDQHLAKSKSRAEVFNLLLQMETQTPKPNA